MTAPAAPKTLQLDADSFLPRLQGYWDTLADWVQGNAVELGIALAAAVIVFLLLSWLKRIAAKIARENENRAELKSIIARTLARTSKFFRIMVAVELVNRYANAPTMLARLPAANCDWAPHVCAWAWRMCGNCCPTARSTPIWWLGTSPTS
jgi:hypothetical protein